jgi:hypothetical protein
MSFCNVGAEVSFAGSTAPRLKPRTLRARPRFDPGGVAKRPNLLQRLYSCREPRLVAGSCLVVQRALLDCPIEGGDCLAVDLFGGLFIALSDGLAQFPQGTAEAGSVSPVAGSAPFGLTGAFQRRKMISHGWFVTFVCIARYSASTEYVILRDSVSAGQTHGIASYPGSAGAAESPA